MSAAPSPPQRFEFASAGTVGRWGRRLGIRAPSLVLEGGRLEVHFGPWSLTTPLTNVCCATITGPYRWWKVAGPVRLSLADRGLTMATSTGPGVCIGFREPVPGIDPLGLVRHPALTVTVEDPAALASALSVPDAVPLRVARPRASLAAALRALVRWRSRSSSVDVTERASAVVDVPAAATSPRADGQPMTTGVGDAFHRTYSVDIEGASTSAEAVMARLQADPDLLADGELAVFVRERGGTGRMAVGDRFTVEIAGPWRGPVEVVEVSPRAFRLATLEGHMEAGAVEFRVEDVGDGRLRFTIESWARSSSVAFDAVYDRLTLARDLQSEMWVTACERIVAQTGGAPAGPVQVDIERAAGAGASVGDEHDRHAPRP